jgi:sulfur-oxidizing protein SoxY
MGKSGALDGLGRRELLIGAGLFALAASLAGADGLLAQGTDPESNGWESALKLLTDSRKLNEGKITLDIADAVENGNTVPFSAAVESPMSERSYVKAIHIISTGNPLPTVASFHFTPASGKAAVSSRMRLAQSQTVIGVAEFSDGQVHLVRKMVKVTVGGCGG